MPDEDVAAEELEWSAFYDDDGRLYYYNRVSGESSWDAPEHYHPAPERPPADEGASSSAWVAYEAEDGQIYYFNPETNETTWDKPEGFVEPVQAMDHVESTATTSNGTPDDEAGGISPIRTSSPVPDSEEVPAAMDVDAPSTMPESEKEAEHLDPAVARLDEAMTALKQTDAIMEPGTFGFEYLISLTTGMIARYLTGTTFARRGVGACSRSVSSERQPSSY
jgi:WW domain